MLDDISFFCVCGFQMMLDGFGIMCDKFVWNLGDFRRTMILDRCILDLFRQVYMDFRVLFDRC